MDFIKQLQKALTTDPEYRETWKANIAMAFKDEYFATYASGYAPQEEPHSTELVHIIANKAADRFLDMFCHVAAGSNEAIKQPEINATEAVYGFAAWLTTNRKRIVMSSRHNAAPVVEAVVEFCNTNNLPPLVDGWEQKVQFPNLIKTLQEKRTEMGQRLFTRQGELQMEDEDDQPEVTGAPAETAAPPSSADMVADTSDIKNIAASMEGPVNFEGAPTFTIPPIGDEIGAAIPDAPPTAIKLDDQPF